MTAGGSVPRSMTGVFDTGRGAAQDRLGSGRDFPRRWTGGCRAGPSRYRPGRHRQSFAGRYVEQIQGLIDDLKPLGFSMARRLIDALGGDPAVVQGYGKGAIVGAAGELEPAALWHSPGVYAMRELLGAPRPSCRRPRSSAPARASMYRSLM